MRFNYIVLGRSDVRNFLQQFLKPTIYYIKTESMKPDHKFARCLGSTDQNQ